MSWEKFDWRQQKEIFFKFEKKKEKKGPHSKKTGKINKSSVNTQDFHTISNFQEK